jgi:hypothetical protein
MMIVTQTVLPWIEMQVHPHVMTEVRHAHVPQEVNPNVSSVVVVVKSDEKEKQKAAKHHGDPSNDLSSGCF